MAELSGLVVGAIPLLNLVDTCRSFYEQIQSLKTKDKDIDYIICRAGFEQTRFALLQKRVATPGILWHISAQKLVRLTLAQSKVALQSLYTLLCYHLHYSDEQDLERPKLGNLVSRAVKWIGKDQKKATELVTRLKELNEQLEVMLPKEQRAAVNFGFTAQLIATNDIAELRRIAAASRPGLPDLTFNAETKALRIESLSGLSTTGKELERSQITNLDAFRWESSSVPYRTRFDHWTCSSTLHRVMHKERVLACFSPVTQDSTEPNRVPVLVEWRSGFQSTGSLQRNRYRLDQLVMALTHLSSLGVESTLSDPEPASTLPAPESIPHDANRIKIGTLKCLGWLAADDLLSHVGLVFQFPPDKHRKPTSLFQMIKEDREFNRPVPALGTRFTIATKLVEAVANLILVGWIHKSMRSHNVLIFEPDSSTTQFGRCHHNFDQMYLTGFSYARPGSLSDIKDMSTLPTHDAVHELYQPSSEVLQQLRASYCRQSNKDDYGSVSAAQVHIRHDAALDVYGLGIILLEIAMWRNIDFIYRHIKRGSGGHNTGHHPTQVHNENINKFDPSITDNIDPQNARQSSMFEDLILSLEPRVGLCYCNVIRKCLALEGWGDPAPNTTGPPPREEPAEHNRNIVPTTIEAAKQECEIQPSREVVFLESLISSLSQCAA